MKKLLLYSLFLVFAASCEGPDGPEGPAGPNGTAGNTSLVDMTNEDPGDRCASGGLMITTGIDANNNGKLEETEITKTRYVCNGGEAPKEMRIGYFEMFSKSADVEEYAVISLNDFDIANYPGYDSVSFVLRDAQALDENMDPTASIEYTVEAVDRSNEDAPIEGSQLTPVNAGNFVSPNFHDNIPEGTFDLGIKVTRVTAAVGSFETYGYIVLYRKD